jgi:membrane protein implicated in regulation of membrane protease activity
VLAPVGATLSGFSLVFLGVTLPPSRPGKNGAEMTMIIGLLILFYLGLISVGLSLLWLYFSAPRSLKVPVLSYISLNSYYQAAWVTFAVTAVSSVFVVWFAVITARRRKPGDQQQRIDTLEAMVRELLGRTPAERDDRQQAGGDPVAPVRGPQSASGTQNAS